MKSDQIDRLKEGNKIMEKRGDQGKVNLKLIVATSISMKIIVHWIFQISRYNWLKDLKDLKDSVSSFPAVGL